MTNGALRNTTLAVQRPDIFVAGTIALMLLACSAYRVTPSVSGVYHDDAIYVLSAKALATGHGYRLTTVPGAPAQTKYPVLYPAVLSVAWMLWPSFPDNVLALQMISMIAGAVAVALAYLYLVRFGYATRAMAAGAGAIAATSPSVHYFSTLTLSEMTFAVLTVAALWTLDALPSRRPSSALHELGAGMIVAAPFLCRSVGIVLPVAGIALLCWRARRLRWWLATGSAVVVTPWILWIYLVSAPGDQLTEYYTQYLSDWMTAAPSLATVATTNLFLVISNSGMLVADGAREAMLTSGSTWIRAGYVCVCLMAGALTWKAIADGARRNRVLPSILVAYSAVLLVWPWPPFRFLIPVLPFIVAYGLTSAAELLRPVIRPSVRRTLLLSTVVLVIVVNVSWTAVLGRINHQTGYPYFTVPAQPIKWSSYQRLFAWLRANTRDDDVLASGVDSMVSLYTGRTALRPFVHRPLSLFYGDAYPATGTVDEFRTVLKSNHVQFLVVVPLPNFAEDAPFSKLIVSWGAAYPQESRLVYTDDAFRVFHVPASD